jgi:hypothetical protein
VFPSLAKETKFGDYGGSFGSLEIKNIRRDIDNGMLRARSLLIHIRIKYKMMQRRV